MYLTMMKRDRQINVSEIQRYKRNGDLTFDLHLHNQNGLISTWRYYVICLAAHTGYTYKILAQSGQWLMRYSTCNENIWPLTVIGISKMASYQRDLIYNMLVWSHYICIQNMDSIGPMIFELQNKRNRVCVCVYI